jgi:hypothetical protein
MTNKDGSLVFYIVSSMLLAFVVLLDAMLVRNKLPDEKQAN